MVKFPSVIVLTLALFISHAKAEFWEQIYSYDGNIFEIITNDDLTMFLGVSDGVLRSQDGGVNWELVRESNIATSIQFNSNNHVYAAPIPMGFSIDFGDSWEDISVPNGLMSYIFIDSEDTIYFGSNNLYKSTDNGQNWTMVIDLDSGVEFIHSIIETTDGVLFAGSTNFMPWASDQGGIYRSLDGGDSWENIALVDVGVKSLALNSQNHIFVAATNSPDYPGGAAYRSVDNGDSWEVINSNLSFTTIVCDDDDNLYLGSDITNGTAGGVYSSTDNGVSWNLIESEVITTGAHVRKLYISKNGYFYTIVNGVQKDKLFRSTLPVSSIEEEDNLAKSYDFQLNNYPNPFNPKTTIYFDLLKRSNTILKLFNGKGELVEELINGYRDSGKHSINFDGSYLSSGVYYYKLIVNGSEVTKRMVLLK